MPGTARIESGHKAPSAKRCIKTEYDAVSERAAPAVIKHRAPNGALRRSAVADFTVASTPVIKHRAPNGALRLECCAAIDCADES